MTLSALAESVLSARLSLEQAEEKLLRAAGWRATSETPDFCWRWEKRIKGRLWALHKDEALRLAIDEHLEAVDE